ncbi:DUF6283 family protein [Burkholderia cepacia]|uniref:DUF6283 family protein n=1 Tax=Burkholderia cepacia TaxID=292 RepID=UPI0038BBE5F0
MNRLTQPCASCPWRTSARAEDIPNFSMDLAEQLAATCPDSRGMGPNYGARVFACHQSKIDDEFACAGWLAKVGHRHPEIRLAVTRGQLEPSALAPGNGWPALHDNYADVLEKLRATMATPKGRRRREHDD